MRTDSHPRVRGPRRRHVGRVPRVDVGGTASHRGPKRGHRVNQPAIVRPVRAASAERDDDAVGDERRCPQYGGPPDRHDRRDRRPRRTPVGRAGAGGRGGAQRRRLDPIQLNSAMLRLFVPNYRANGRPCTATTHQRRPRCACSLSVAESGHICIHHTSGRYTMSCTKRLCN